MDKHITIPHYLVLGVFPSKRGFPKDHEIIVCDTETAMGKPYLIQFYDGEDITLREVDTDTIFPVFIKYLNEKCMHKGTSRIVFFHNMQFDITAILDKYPEIFQYNKSPTVICPGEDGNEIGRVKLYCQKTWYGSVKLPNNATVNLVDSANFMQGSLYDLSRKLNLKHKKPERPKGVEEGKKIQSLDDPEFKSYVEKEILSEYDLASYIINMHSHYNVNFSVSSSQFASKVFKKHFLDKVIPQCPQEIRKTVEQSLHGGRAGNFVEGIQVIPDVRLYDYNSFYPHAMASLQPMTSGKWEKVEEFVDGSEGFYLVDGKVKDCKWPIVLKNPGNFAYANNEDIKGVAISSYELKEALGSCEFAPSSIKGWIWVPNEDSKNPFRDYVHEFYEKKNTTPKDDPRYVMYKLLLNQLYGKTYQTIRSDEYQETPEYTWNNGSIRRSEIRYRAGGLYLPHVGAWITSLCRAQLHQDLHSYEALMCATDSFLTTRKARTGKKLGDLKLECEGLGLLIRPKMYFVFSRDIQKEVEGEGDLRAYLTKNLGNLELEKDIVKYATHGFWGTPYQLLDLYVKGEADYSYRHMNKIRESLIQHKTPRVMEEGRRSLKIDWKEERGFCGMLKHEAMRTKELCNGCCFTCAYSYY